MEQLAEVCAREEMKVAEEKEDEEDVDDDEDEVATSTVETLPCFEIFKLSKRVSTWPPSRSRALVRRGSLLASL